MYYSKDKMLNKVIADEVASGAHVVQGRKHAKLFLPSGGLLVFSRTPSDRRAYRNAKAELARLRKSRVQA